MKKIILCLTLIIASQMMHSQNIIYGEYFIDAETGFGNATPFSIALPDSDITQSFNIPYSAFPSPGYHYVYIRTLDANGNWSITSRTLVQADDTINTFSVVNIEYFFDTDNGFGANASAQLVPATDSTWTFNIPYNQIPVAWTPNDTLFLRVQDSIKGNWSITTMIDSSNVVGMNELTQLTGVKVYPNPVSQKLNVHLNEYTEFSFVITDLFGHRIISETELHQTKQINVEILPAGIYLLTVITKDGSAVKKFIKQ